MSSSGTFPKGSSHGKRAGQEKGGRGGGGGGGGGRIIYTGIFLLF